MKKGSSCSMENRKTILVADDHPVVREGIVNVVKSIPAYEIIQECGNGVDAIQYIRELQPDVVLLDISMPGMSGIDVIRQARKEDIPSDFVILTMYDDEEYFEEALDVGVKGYLLKENALMELENCLKSVFAGKFYICPTLSGFLVKNNQKAKTLLAKTPGLAELTKTERKILTLLSENKTSKEIAEKLFVSVRTIQNHRNNICQKLNLRGPHSLLEFAIRHRSELGSF
jgi:DNA-binding NarL/FixJ family response regulator